VCVRERELRQESESLATAVANTATDLNPVVVSIVGLLETTPVSDDRVTFTKRAMSENGLATIRSPINFQVDLIFGKWDKENRSNRGSARAVTGQDLGPSGVSPPNTKNSTGKE
jgi:hypothetical protein